MIQYEFTQQGWECPKCGRVYSPTTVMCLICPQKVNTNTTTETPTIGTPNGTPNPYRGGTSTATFDPNKIKFSL